MGSGGTKTTVRKSENDSEPISPAAASRPPSKIPSNFVMRGGAKETHGNPIYCVSWSTDVHRNTPVGSPGDDPPAKECNGKVNSEESDVESNKISEGTSENSNSQVNSTDAPLLRCLATCGGNHLTVYEVGVSKPGSASTPSSNEGFVLRQAYVDPDEEEVYYACAFGGRSLGRPFRYGPMEAESEPIVLREDDDNKRNANKRPRRELFQDMIDMQSFDGPQLLCVGGSRGVIKVVDTVRKMLILTLSGHGDEIYDLNFCPTDEWLLLSASKDESLRLWNVKTATNVAIFAGHEGHRDSILSLAWHPLGDKFASAGMDTTVKIWSIEEGTEVSNAIASSAKVKPRIKDASLEKASDRAAPFRTVYEQMPVFSSNKIHTDYIDCIQFVGDLVLSKSISNAIVLWKPLLSKANRGANKAGHHRLPNEVIALREFTLTKCDVWFVRFQTDINCQMLAIGNTNGEVKLWEIGSNPTKKHFAYLSHTHCVSTVRMVSFSPDAKCLVASCDDATIWKWDAV